MSVFSWMRKLFPKDGLAGRDVLEVDEIFFDGHQLAGRDFGWRNRLEKRIPEKNLKRLIMVVLAGLSLVSLRVAYLSLFKGQAFTLKARANYVKEVWDKAPRGLIYYSNGKPLVENTLSFNLVLVPAELPRDREDQEKIVAALAEFLKKPAEEIKKALQNIDRFSFRPVLLLEDLSHDELLAFRGGLEVWQGLRLEENFKRDYKGAGIFNHVLGYTGRVTEKDIKENQGYLLTDTVGKNGLEGQYEHVLRGRRGVTLVETRARGGVGRVVGTYGSEAGNNLVLFLDADLQARITEVMSKTLASLGIGRAAAVAIDPKSGGVLALQSFPLFDGNVFSSRLSAADYRNIFENKNQPLFNRAVSGVYPPGSTIKPFLGVAALQEKVVDDKTTVFDSGSIAVGSQEFRGWTALGVVDIYKAIAMSSNIFFYSVGGGYGNIAGLGPLKMVDYLKRFGFSAPTKIDLPGEAAGFLPTPEWKRLKKKEAWYIGDTYNMSIGQGYIQATPLQLAAATAAVANRGALIGPRVVKSVIDKNGKVVQAMSPEISSKNFVDQWSLEIIRKAMRETALSGSARSLSRLDGGAGAKTGTAETGLGGNTHAWFTVFAPYEDPRIVLTIIVENGGEGSSVAVPIAREVLEWYLTK